MGHESAKSIALARQFRQNVCPHGVVTGSNSSFEQMIQSKQSPNAATQVSSSTRRRFPGDGRRGDGGGVRERFDAERSRRPPEMITCRMACNSATQRACSGWDSACSSSARASSARESDTNVVLRCLRHSKPTHVPTHWQEPGDFCGERGGVRFDIWVREREGGGYWRR